MIIDQWIFLFLSTVLGHLPYEHIIFHFAGNYRKKCASSDIQYIYFPLTLPDPYHFEIF